MKSTGKEAGPLRHAIARSIGLSAAVYGYPLVEMLRRCHAQTVSAFSRDGKAGPSIDELVHSDRAPVAGLSIGNRMLGCLYTSGWIFLGDGPRALSWPSPEAGCALLLSVYDASSEAIVHLAPDMEPGRLDAVLFTRQGEAASAGDDRRVVHAGTDLVWVVGRILFDPARADEARAFQRGIHLNCGAEGPRRRRPSAVEMWQGDSVDTVVELSLGRSRAETVAPAFYRNLCRAMTQLRGSARDTELTSAFRYAGLAPDAMLDWAALDEDTRSGLAAGLEDAARMVSSGSPRPTDRRFRSAQGAHYLARARSAYALSAQAAG